MVHRNYFNELDIPIARADFSFIDPATDLVVATDTTEQCGALQAAAISTTGNGDTYFSITQRPRPPNEADH